MPRSSTRTAIDLVALALIAAVLRCVYLLATWHVYGDGVQYADIAGRIARGEPVTEGLLTWMQGFSLWEAPFHFIIESPLAAAAVASLIPGILLVIPVYFLGRSLYGRITGLIAGTIIALHPFLIHYSTNGYLETLYLLFFTSGIAALTRYLNRPSWGAIACFGTAFGLALTVRNEVAPVFAAGLAVPALAWIIRRLRNENPPRNLANGALHCGIAILCFAAVVTAFGISSQKLAGTSGLFKKAENFSRVHDVYSERAEAAKELLGHGGHLDTPGETELSPSIVLTALAQRVPKNIVPLAKSIPPVLANPVFLLSIVPLFLWWRRGRRIEVAHLPSLMMLAFSPSFYVLFFVEPRYLIASLVPLTVYSAEGMRICFAGWPSFSKRTRFALGAGATLCLLLFVAASVVRGMRAREDAELHRQTADLLTRTIPVDEMVIGCGFGYITDSAFRSGHPIERRLVTDDPEDLATYVKSLGGRWMVLYEGFLTSANPALLETFTSGVPGFTEVGSARSSPGHSAHLYRLD